MGFSDWQKPYPEQGPGAAVPLQCLPWAPAAPYAPAACAGEAQRMGLNRRTDELGKDLRVQPLPEHHCIN